MIEDLAEWMEDAFTRYSTSPADSGASDQTLTLRVPSPKSIIQPPHPSPLASASEGEMDSPITFVPKKQTRREPAGEPSTTRVQTLHTRGDSSASGSETVVSSASDTHKVAGLVKGAAGSGTPEKTGTPRLAGQVITEEELMRRRRLLDSYILD